MCVPPKPHAFVNLPLQSCTPDLTEIVSSLSSLIPQLTNFIEQFNNVVIESNVNVLTDSFGNMSVDVPSDMSDAKANLISKKLGIIDKLINTQGQSIKDLLEKGLKIEQDLKASNSNYSSVLNEKVSVFKALNASYKH